MTKTIYILVVLSLIVMGCEKPFNPADFVKHDYEKMYQIGDVYILTVQEEVNWVRNEGKFPVKVVYKCFDPNPPGISNLEKTIQQGYTLSMDTSGHKHWRVQILPLDGGVLLGELFSAEVEFKIRIQKK